MPARRTYSKGFRKVRQVGRFTCLNQMSNIVLAECCFMPQPFPHSKNIQQSDGENRWRNSRLNQNGLEWATDVFTQHPAAHGQMSYLCLSPAPKFLWKSGRSGLCPNKRCRVSPARTQGLFASKGDVGMALNPWFWLVGLKRNPKGNCFDLGVPEC